MSRFRTNPRGLGVLVSALALVLVPSAALGKHKASFKTGTYTGSTTSFGVTVNVANKHSLGFAISYKMQCADGTSQARTTSIPAIAIKKGKFHRDVTFTSGSAKGAKAHVDGMLKGKSASGNFSRSGPLGSTTCSSGNIAWSAKH